MQAIVNLWYTFHVQIFWNYHTMVGVGSCYLLDKLYGNEQLPESIRYRMVLFFNGQPYLVPYAVSAIACELKKGSNETKLERFIQSVVGMLGAIGDHYYWNGLKPILLLSLTAFSFLKIEASLMILITLLEFLVYNYIQCKERLRGISAGERLGFGVVKELKQIKSRFGYRNFPKISFYIILSLLGIVIISLSFSVEIALISLIAFGLGLLSGKKGNELIYLILSVFIFIGIEFFVKIL